MYQAFKIIVSKIGDEKNNHTSKPAINLISGRFAKGETVYDIFKRHGLKMEDLSVMRKAAFEVHRLKDVRDGQPYSIAADEYGRVDSFVYWIDDDYRLKIKKDQGEFWAMKYKNPYEIRIKTIRGTIRDNLISAIGSSTDEVQLALKISDIFAWDIDFTSDLSLGDTFTIVVEGFYFDGLFRKYGDIFCVEFINNGKRYIAYRFLNDGKAGYYDDAGNSLKKAFLKAPLSFRRISSAFSGRRFHPVLKKYRPHRAVDYAAAKGTPVSATADGTVSFAGWRGQYGNLIILRHRNLYKTYYGHLCRIRKGIRKGIHVKQGDIIGYVGATGLATGPHLHYEVRHAGKHVNPLVMKLAGDPISPERITRFLEIKTEMDEILKSQAKGKGYFSLTGKDITYSETGG